MEIIPAILTADVQKLDQTLRELRDCKRFHRVQIDFIDGEYADNRTIKPTECDLIPYLPLQFDAHLMVTESNVWEYEKTARKMGFTRVAAQLESISNPEDFEGLAIDVHSPVESIEAYLPDLTWVIVMAVEPGFGGQKLQASIYEKITRLSELRSANHWGYKICVDGGVREEMLEKLAEAGADEVAVGAERALKFK